MKVLLDENLPKGLKKDFPGHNVFTVRDKNWNSKKNGELIRLMLEDGFDVLITFDQNITHQQNLSKYPICLIVLKAQINTYEILKKFVPVYFLVDRKKDLLFWNDTRLIFDPKSLLLRLNY